MRVGLNALTMTRRETKSASWQRDGDRESFQFGIRKKYILPCGAVNILGLKRLTHDL